MDQSKLDGLYDQADSKKLLEMFKQSQMLQDRASVMENKAESIIENLAKTVRNRFVMNTSKYNASDFDKIGDYQVEEMAKQWSIMSASMLTVCRSVQLTGFHNCHDRSMDLYVHPAYGIKIKKRMSSWHPFRSIDLKDSVEKFSEPLYKYENNRLLMIGSWDKGSLDFMSLYSIPQLDSNKVDQLMELTKETVHMVDDWRKFWGASDAARITNLKLIEVVSRDASYRCIDEDDLFKVIKNMEDLLVFKKQFVSEVEEQAVKFKSTLDKWKKINKNFVVLNELTKTQLKV